MRSHVNQDFPDSRLLFIYDGEAS